MSTLTKAINQLLASKWNQVVAAQESHRSSVGRFCQLLATTDAVPADGAEVTPDRLSRKAAGEQKSWDDFAGILPAKLRSKIEVNIYDGPEGQGFTLDLTIQEGGRTLRRSLNHGPEDWRESGEWEDITPSAGEPPDGSGGMAAGRQGVG